MTHEIEVGHVSHYFSNLGVAAIEVEEGSIEVGDLVHIQGRTSDFTQRVESMEIDHRKVAAAGMGDSIGVKVCEHAREHDHVYKVVG